MKLFQLGNGSKLSIAPQIAVVMLVVGLAGAMAIEPTRQLLEQRTRIADMSGELRSIEKANDRLQNRVDRLNDPDYLEQQAREQSGLVRPGETSVIVMPPADPEASKEKKDPAPIKAPPAQDSGLLDSMLNFLGLG
ncbi:MAG TPA: septum formation initiator family protein [Actinomycetota bacterium]|nr:septum formation initiator family protein [Actinomycetota bacterium]